MNQSGAQNLTIRPQCLETNLIISARRIVGSHGGGSSDGGSSGGVCLGLLLCLVGGPLARQLLGVCQELLGATLGLNLLRRQVLLLDTLGKTRTEKFLRG